ncbi:MAG: hypothetical protein AAFU63_09160 [Pseudomonadota bacterium]
MKRIAAVCLLAAGVASCGDGNPFTDTGDSGGGGTTPPASGVPAEILNDLERIDFNATDNTLTVTGLTQDGEPVVNEYRAIASTFAPGFTTFTGQNDPLGRHATAFVASRDGGLQAGVVMTGGQFNRFFGGSFFERDGSYNPPPTEDGRFDVTYVGSYAGGINSAGPVTDLFPVPPGVDPDVDLPTQTAYVRGLIFLNVDFSDMAVEGEVFDRTGVFAGGFADLPDIVLVEGALAEDGSFAGNIEFDASDPNPDIPENPVGRDIGDFAGIIGGPQGESIVGGTSLEEFSDAVENELEFGVFVLDLCTAASTDPICVASLAP